LWPSFFVDGLFCRQQAQLGAIEAGTHQVVNGRLQLVGTVEHTNRLADRAFLLFSGHLGFSRWNELVPRTTE
jgi:hypothetical protein